MSDKLPVTPKALELQIRRLGQVLMRVDVDEPLVEVKKSALSHGCEIAAYGRSGAVRSERVVWIGESELTLRLATVVTCRVYVRNEAGSALEGLVYLHVNMHPRPRVKKQDIVKIEKKGSNVELRVEEMESSLVAYAPGYVPDRRVVRSLVGFPWNLDSLTITLTLGNKAFGRVLDMSGNGVAGQDVSIQSFAREMTDKVGEEALVSFGMDHSRLSGGVWETVVTKDDGYFECTGVGPAADTIKVCVLGPRLQRSGMESLIHRKQERDVYVDVIVE